VANLRLKFTPSALDDLTPFKKQERKAILDGIDKQLVDEPHVETRNRKRLRPNRTSEWEVGIGKYRVFYDVRQSDRIVEVRMIGEKRGNMVLVRGEEHEL
jgi:mRNA-degrading endonuclease RelE of RelBE toxin-antitoxin system